MIPLSPDYSFRYDMTRVIHVQILPTGERYLPKSAEMQQNAN